MKNYMYIFHLLTVYCCGIFGEASLFILLSIISFFCSWLMMFTRQLVL